jgi:hypothetical protein
MNPQYTVDPPYPTGEGLYGECAAKFKIALSIVTVFTYLEKVINHEETKENEERGRSSISSTFYAFSSLRSLRFFVVSFS